MIYFVTGRPRGGKSYYSVLQVLEELRKTERQIITNLPLNLELLAEWCNEHIEKPVDIRKRVRILNEGEVRKFYLFRVGGEDPVSLVIPGLKETMPDFSSRQQPEFPGTLYVIDEVHIYFSARSWQTAGEAVEFFCSQHGHLRCDVIFVTQHCEKVDKNFRRNAQEYILMRNCGNERFFNIPVFGGVRFGGVLRREHFLEPPGPASKPFETATMRLNIKEIGKLYDTSAGVGLTGRVDTQEKPKGGHWGKLPVFILALVLLCACVPWAVGKVIQRGVGMVLGGANRGGVMVSNVAASASSAVPVGHPAVSGGSVGVGAVSARPGAGAGAGEVPPASRGPVVHLTGVMGRAGVILDDGRVLESPDYHWDLVRGGVFVEGLGFFPWGHSRSPSASVPVAAVVVAGQPGPVVVDGPGQSSGDGEPWAGAAVPLGLQSGPDVMAGRLAHRRGEVGMVNRVR